MGSILISLESSQKFEMFLAFHLVIVMQHMAFLLRTLCEKRLFLAANNYNDSKLTDLDF